MRLATIPELLEHPPRFVHLYEIPGTQVSRVTCREIANYTRTALWIFRPIGLNEYRVMR
jgi:hypothetical protein